MTTTGSFYECHYPLLDPAAVDRGAYLRDLERCLAGMVPVAMPYQLIRIGGGEDGGYLLPDDLGGIAACFSPGVDNRKDFEDELAAGYAIKSHMCDYSSDETRLKTPLIPGMQTFRKCWLDTTTSATAVTLDQWVGELAPGTDDLMLQIDIEGAEFRNILNCSDATLQRFRILCIEIHQLFELADPSLFYGVFLPFFEKLSKHFVAVHAHPNNYNPAMILPGTAINVPNCIELTLLRRDRLAAAPGAALIDPQIPHRLDFINAADCEPIVLNEFWLGGRARSAEARAIILADELAYVRRTTERKLDNAYAAIENLATIVARLSERQVEHPPAPGLTADPLIEVAAGKPFTVSSALEDLPSDPRIPADFAAPYFFHTKFEADQFIEIDLGLIQPVSVIEIHNRPGQVLRDRAYPLFFTLSRADGDENAQVSTIRISDDFTFGRAPLVKRFTPSIPARFVRIGTPARAYLHFMGLRIYADPPGGDGGNGAASAPRRRLRSLLQR